MIVKKYYQDLTNRLVKGELQSEDSIVFPDSPKYETLIKKRTVYGGGGIMPDVFVPLDTSFFSDYYQNIITKGVLNKTVSKYVLEQEKLLRNKYKTANNFVQNYKVESTLLEQLVENAEKSGMAFDQVQYELSKTYIETLIKAIIARDLWNSSAYFQIINEQDLVLQRTIEILQNNEAEKFLK